MKRVCVFCGSKDGDSPIFKTTAFELGAALASRNIELVYGGAQSGLMGAVADGVLANGGRVIGVIPAGLARQEFAHAKLTEKHLTKTMAERKDLMTALADGFVTLPGGFGTMDELFEVLTGAQVGLHRKPIGLLDLNGFYAPIVAWIRESLARGFIPRVLESALVVRDQPAALVDALIAHEPPPSAITWLTSSVT